MILARHLYSGKLVDIWMAWEESNPYNYSLGSTEQEAREQLSLRPKVIFEQRGDQWIARHGALSAHSNDRKVAERTLRELIERKAGRLNWKDHFLKLAAATGQFWEDVVWEDEIPIIKEMLGQSSSPLPPASEPLVRLSEPATEDC